MTDPFVPGRPAGASRESSARPEDSGSVHDATTRRPKRWDHPFDESMSEEMVSDLMTGEPWRSLAAWAESALEPAAAASRIKDLRRHLLNDMRVRSYQPGELVVRVGDYGNSAFIVLHGAVRVVLDVGSLGLGAKAERKFDLRRRGFFRSLAQLVARPRAIEERPPPRGDAPAEGKAAAESYVPILLGDVGAVLDEHRTALIGEGGIVGEVGALGRTPRTATVFADRSGANLLEIRWQGLRDIRGTFPPFKTYVDDRFRERVLLHLLRATPFLRHVGDTPEVRRRLAAGQMREVFVEGIGLAPARDGVLRAELSGQPLELRPLAQARGWAGSAGLVIYHCEGVPEAAVRQAESLVSMMLRVCKETRSKAVIVMPRRRGHQWIWCLAEPDAAEAADVHLYHQEEPQSLGDPLRDLLHELTLHEIGRLTDFDNYRELDQVARDGDAASEAVIVEEGHYPDALLLVRAGTVRVSCLVGGQRRTVSYLGPSQAYGLAELAHNWRHPERHVAVQHTLHARGYVDLLRIPASVIARHVLPSIPEDQLPPSFEEGADEPLDPVQLLAGRVGAERSLVEFLVDRGFVNGTAAMVIDLERCTRCDDCVRACAQSHGGNPRFIRHGPIQAGHMIANACMHCIDPVCMIGCPTGAISREPATGYVVINDPTCIGCATCATNCPYDNIRMVHSRSADGSFYLDAHNVAHQKATKCDLCVTQVGGPACQRACPHDALHRVDLTDAGSLAPGLRV
jgi:Fe-S-cluster-containing dehydrogenase component/CRP-like cAMP-binding protein